VKETEGMAEFYPNQIDGAGGLRREKGKEVRWGDRGVRESTAPAIERGGVRGDFVRKARENGMCRGRVEEGKNVVVNDS